MSLTEDERAFLIMLHRIVQNAIHGNDVRCIILAGWSPAPAPVRDGRAPPN